MERPQMDYQETEINNILISAIYDLVSNIDYEYEHGAINDTERILMLDGAHMMARHMLTALTAYYSDTPKVRNHVYAWLEFTIENMIYDI